MNKKIFSIIVAILLVSPILAIAQKQETPEYLAAKKIVDILPTFANLVKEPESEEDVIYYLWLSGLGKKKAQSLPELTTQNFPELSALDSQIRDNIKNDVNKFGIDKIKSTLANESTAPLNPFTEKPFTASDIDFNIYASPIFYKETGLPYYFSIGWRLFAALLILNLIRMIFNKDARNLKGLIGLSWFIKHKDVVKLRSFVPFLKERKNEIDELRKLFDEKKKLLHDNEASMTRLSQMIMKKEGLVEKEDIAKLWEQDVQEFEKTWESTLLKAVKIKNIELKKKLEKYLKYLEKFEKGFRREFESVLKQDREIVELLEAKIFKRTGSVYRAESKTLDIENGGMTMENLLYALEKIKETLGEEQELITSKYHPQENNLANALRKIITLSDVEESLIKREDEVLHAMSVGRVSKGKDMLELIGMLKELVKDKAQKAEDEAKIFEEISKAEGKIGEVKGEINQNESKIKKAMEISNEMLQNPRKYFASSPAVAPLYLKDLGGVPIKPLGEINNLEELRIRILPPAYSKHKEIAISDASAYQMMKPKDGKPEMVVWIARECENPELAKRVKDVIEREGVPAEIKIISKDTLVERGISTELYFGHPEEVIPRLNRARIRIAELIEDAFPPLKPKL